jgi:glycosyltransferase involved in cell wall biosynthesis
VIKEAFVAGIPIIVSDRGSTGEMIEHGVNGLHFRAGDAADLRRQLQRIVSEEGLLARLRAGIPRVKNIAENAQEMIEIYKQITHREVAT